ncbi:MAG: hypothetical protein ACF8NJ_10285, partial [Phycisphaerales bacterium JB038]
MKARPRRCAFCRKPQVSAEHVFPAWLSEALTGEGQVGLTLFERPHGQERETKGFDTVVKRVCRECNNGWMADLEGAAKAVMVPMLLQDRYVELLPDAVRVLATWAYKTALMVEFVSTRPTPDGRDQPPAPQDCFSEFHVRRTPPPDAAIWLASYHMRGSGDALVSYRETRLRLLNPADITTFERTGRLPPNPEVARHFVTTIAAGAVVLQVAGALDDLTEDVVAVL